MITYSKLKNGDWGLRGAPNELKTGAVVSVTKKDGSKNLEAVGRVLWTGDGVALATIQKSERASSSRSTGGSVCAECGRRGALVQDLEDGLMKHYRCCDIPPG